MIQIKNINDYYEQLYDKFPNVPKKDILKICQYGWKQLYLLNSYGGDVIITDNNFWSFIGTLRKDSIKHFYYYIKKMTIKLRVMFKRKKIKWDGYYYFMLNEEEYESYTSLIHKRGRPRKWFNFLNIFLYKIKDECIITQFTKTHLFRIPYYFEGGFKIFKEDIISDKVEYLEEIPKRKFQDILVTNYKYEFL